MTDERQQRIDDSIAKQLAQSIQRNSVLANENQRLLLIAEALRAALKPFGSPDMGQHLLWLLDDMPSLGKERMKQLIDAVDRTLAKADEVLK